MKEADNVKKHLLISLYILVFLFVAGVCSYAYDELHVNAMLTANEPDVVADTITRTTQTGRLPILLILRHTDAYPTILKRVRITFEVEGNETPTEMVVDYNLKLKRPWWHDVVYAEVWNNQFKHRIIINVYFELQIKGKDKIIVNNNLRDYKGNPLEVKMGVPYLPRFKGWQYGDAHFHTLFSDNAVEFGAPVNVSALFGQLFGLGWMVFTDHSFDLDDVDGDSNTNDPDLGRWHRYLSEIEAAAEADSRMVLVHGEELSCGNKQGQNVHMLVYNNSEFLPGNGDGYENGSTPDLACADVTASLSESEAAFAAHPITDLRDVETKILNRGNWALEDALDPNLTGLQAWNHDYAPHPDGLAQWIEVLLQGRHKYLLAGSDAHGDFNMAYHVGKNRLSFGNVRSAVYVGDTFTKESLIKGLKQGNIVVTNGPAAMLELINGQGDSAIVGQSITGGPFTAALSARSTYEFGPIEEVRVIIGDPDAGEESLLTTYSGEYASDPMDMESTVRLPDDFSSGYVRLEVVSKTDAQEFYAYTNPVWFTR